MGKKAQFDLRKLRENKELTLDRVARDIGCDPTTLSYAERFGVSSFQLALKLAAYYGIPVEDIPQRGAA